MSAPPPLEPARAASTRAGRARPRPDRWRSRPARWCAGCCADRAAHATSGTAPRRGSRGAPPRHSRAAATCRSAPGARRRAARRRTRPAALAAARRPACAARRPSSGPAFGSSSPAHVSARSRRHTRGPAAVIARPARRSRAAAGGQRGGLLPYSTGMKPLAERLKRTLLTLPDAELRVGWLADKLRSLPSAEAARALDSLCEDAESHASEAREVLVTIALLLA